MFHHFQSFIKEQLDNAYLEYKYHKLNRVYRLVINGDVTVSRPGVDHLAGSIEKQNH